MVRDRLRAWPLAAVHITEIRVLSIAAIHRKAEVRTLELRIAAHGDEVDLAFEWLDKAEKHKDTGLTDILNEHLFSNLYEDPRWLPFLERIGYASAQLSSIKFKVTLPN